MALPEPSAWRVEAIRFSFFYAEPQDGRMKDWWKVVTDVHAETTLNRPQVGEYTESGSYAGGQLELKVAFNRIDWILSYPFAGLPEAEQGPDYLETALSLFKRVSSWVAIAPGEIVRVAYGAALMLPITTQVEGNVIISDCLPSFKFDVDKVADLFVQMNYPEVSDLVDGLVVNDLIKLGVMTGQFMQIGIGGMPAVTINHMTRAEFDINTSGDRIDAIPDESVLPLISEMLSKTERVLKEGVKG